VEDHRAVAAIGPVKGDAVFLSRFFGRCIDGQRPICAGGALSAYCKDSVKPVGKLICCWCKPAQRRPPDSHWPGYRCRLIDDILADEYQGTIWRQRASLPAIVGCSLCSAMMLVVLGQCIHTVAVRGCLRLGQFSAPPIVSAREGIIARDRRFCGHCAGVVG
jgi:hypothetical protein